jgi:hypothetical protein
MFSRHSKKKLGLMKKKRTKTNKKRSIKKMRGGDVFNNRFDGTLNEFTENVQKFNQKKLSQNNNILVDSLSSFYRFFLINKEVAVNDKGSHIFIDIKTNDTIFYKNFSKNPNINSNDVLYDIEKPWDFFELGRNESLYFEDVVSIMNKVNDENIKQKIMEGLSENPNVTMKIYRENPNLKWSQEHLSKNPNICISDIQEYNNENQNKWKIHQYLLSENPNLTEDNFLDGWPDIFSWEGYSKNKFTKNPHYKGHCQGMPSGEGFMK